jgi:hypothetical protein
MVTGNKCCANELCCYEEENGKNKENGKSISENHGKKIVNNSYLTMSY